MDNIGPAPTSNLPLSANEWAIMKSDFMHFPVVVFAGIRLLAFLEPAGGLASDPA
jgi:hypothetical protein